MRAGKVAGCGCVRCKWGDTVDLPELMFVHWLNNSPAHGLMGRKARQVNLDENNKVLYSTADSSMSRTGVSSGMGQPEVICDASHCDVLIPYTGAVMKKIKKTSADRDLMPQECLQYMSFCNIMFVRMAPAVAQDQDCLAWLSPAHFKCTSLRVIF